MMKNVLGLAALDDREALRNFIDAMKVAEEASRQMAFYTNNKEWLKVGLLLGGVRERSIALALAGLR